MDGHKDNGLKMKELLCSVYYCGTQECYFFLSPLVGMYTFVCKQIYSDLKWKLYIDILPWITKTIKDSLY